MKHTRTGVRFFTALLALGTLGAGLGEALAAALGQQALVLHVAEQCLEADLVAALDVEMTRDLALADDGRRGLDEFQNIGLRRKKGRGTGLQFGP